jgi:hypothetical protein
MTTKKRKAQGASEYVPPGSVAIETVLSQDDFVPDIPEIVTYRDLADDQPAAPASE